VLGDRRRQPVGPQIAPDPGRLAHTHVPGAVEHVYPAGLEHGHQLIVAVGLPIVVAEHGEDWDIERGA